MILQKNKIYSFKELLQLSKKNTEIKKILNLHNVKISHKEKIYTFEDFDKETKNIYIFIANEIKKLNLNQENLFVCAVGSRIHGHWKTKEESEAIAKNLNSIKIKYSDYDFITNAKNMPNLEILEKKLNIKIDRLVSSKDRVYIPLNIV